MIRLISFVVVDVVVVVVVVVVFVVVVVVVIVKVVVSVVGPTSERCRSYRNGCVCPYVCVSVRSP